MNTKLILGHSDISINRIGLGCMGMSDFYGSSDDQQSLKLLQQALDEGVDFFDTADMYGIGHNETLLGKAFSGKWDKLTLATKFGIRRNPEDGSRSGICGKPEYVKSCCDASLKRLGRDHIDLYYLHRLDPETPLEETIGAMKELVEAGKVRHIGVSELNTANLKKAHAVHPISALQTEFSMWTREARDEVFQTCKDLGITFVAYSPLGRGFLTGQLNRDDLEDKDFRRNVSRLEDDALKQNQAYLDLIKQMAETKKCTMAQIALAWVLQSNQNLVTIPGTRSIQRLRENNAAVSIELTPEQMERIEALLPKQTAGARYPDGMDPRNFQ